MTLKLAKKNVKKKTIETQNAKRKFNRMNRRIIGKEFLGKRRLPGFNAENIFHKKITKKE